MKQIFFHIGLHNTGTTFLQKNFFPYIKNKEIISSEDLSGLPMDGHNVEYRDMLMYGLKCIYPQAKIIVGIRDVQSWIPSLYSHYVKRGGFYSFDYWVNNIFDKRYCDFNSYIDNLKLLFNKQVFVYRFSDFQNNKKKVLCDMCGFIGCELPMYKDKIVNKGWSNNMILFGVHFNRLVGRVREVLNWVNYR